MCCGHDACAILLLLQPLLWLPLFQLLLLGLLLLLCYKSWLLWWLGALLI
jgi:hypothetical protein